jgi:hypothetical protein
LENYFHKVRVQAQGGVDATRSKVRQLQQQDIMYQFAAMTGWC